MILHSPWHCSFCYLYKYNHVWFTSNYYLPIETAVEKVNITSLALLYIYVIKITINYIIYNCGMLYNNIMCIYNT